MTAPRARASVAGAIRSSSIITFRLRMASRYIAEHFGRTRNVLAALVWIAGIGLQVTVLVGVGVRGVASPAGIGGVAALCCAANLWMWMRMRPQRARASASPWLVLGGSPAVFPAMALFGQLTLTGVIFAIAVRPPSVGDLARWLAATVAVSVALSGLVEAGARLPARRSRPRAPGRPPAHARRTPATALAPIGLVSIGRRLFRRTMAGVAIQLFLYAGLVGGLLGASSRMQGRLNVAMAVTAAGMFLATTVAMAVAVRRQVGGQHRFLLQMRPPTPPRVWAQLGRGVILGFIVVVAASFALFAVPTAGAITSILLGAMALEWAIYLGVAAHLLAPPAGGDDWSRPLLLAGTGTAMLVAVLIKGGIAHAIAPWLVPVQAVPCALAALRLLSRPPLALTRAPAARPAAGSAA